MLSCGQGLQHRWSREAEMDICSLQLHGTSRCTCSPEVVHQL